MIIQWKGQIEGIRSDRVPKELGTDVYNIVQETMIKSTPMKQKCNKAKWLSEEALQISEKGRVKGKGVYEIYTHLNAELQRTARRREQCKGIKENTRMGKTRDLFKKIKDTKGTFYEKMGTIKERNSMDLREAEDIKKRLQKYTEELYKKRS